jgi:formamidopyrimidine-DNA glycosylase
VLISALFLSCERKKKSINNDFSFYLPDAHLYFTTSKRMQGKFYVMMSKTNYPTQLSDSVDYIECQTEDGTLVIVFEPNNKNKVCFEYPWVKKVNQKHLQLIKMTPDDFTSKFYQQRVENEPDTLKSPYKELLIAPMSYHITFLRDSTFAHKRVIKDGDMWGE